MDAFKLAFETLIVGLFALPWLWVMIDLVNPDLFHASGLARVMALIPAEMRAPVIGMTLFSLIYLLGSMTTPVAHEFLNDADMLGKWLPTEEAIQAWTYRQSGFSAPRLAKSGTETVSLPEEGARAVIRPDNAAIHTEFQREESGLLLQGTDKCERINRLHEQLTVLRGATFSAFALMVLCGLAWCGRCTSNPEAIGREVPFWQCLRRFGAGLLSVAIIVVAKKQLLLDIHHPEQGDIPIAEILLFIFGGFGVYVAMRGTRSQFHFHGPTFLFGLCFTVLCYAGYGCLENSYDQAVFSTYQTLGTAASGSSHTAERPAMATRLTE